MFPLSVMYAWNRPNDRGPLWTTLHGRPGVPWLLCGDFNCVRIPEEHEGPAPPIPLALTAFNDWLEMEGLVELPIVGGLFTWTGCWGHNVGRSRLDWCFVSSDLFSIFPDSSGYLGDLEVSDHCLLLIFIGTCSLRPPMTFKFFNHWTEHPSFLEVVHKA